MFRSGQAYGPYRLVKKLGTGGFGEVWLAEKLSTAAGAVFRYALKIALDEEADPDAFRKEVKSWAAASGHPNVVAIVDADIWEGTPCIVTEYCEEGSLADWMRARGGGAPGPESAAEMMTGILRGLCHLHERGVLHRDLKPANILLQGEQPRIADFGLARVLVSSRNRSSAAGTPIYMAPEAFDGIRTAQTDLWAAGVILYQLVERRLPFPQATPTEILKAMLTGDPAPLSASTPPGLRRVIESALARDPARRYPTAWAMLAELRAWNGVPPGAITPVAGRQGPALPDLPLSVPSPAPSRPPLVKCPVCGKMNELRETFACQECRADNLCLGHLDPVALVCPACVARRAEALRRQNDGQPTPPPRSVATPPPSPVLAARSLPIGGAPPFRASAASPGRPPVRRRGWVWLLLTLAAVGVTGLVFFLRGPEPTPPKLGSPAAGGGGGAAVPLRLPSLGGAEPKAVSLGPEAGQLPPVVAPAPVGNALGMQFVRIPAGSFAMGSDTPEASDGEKPVHRVTLSRPFELQTTEATQRQWKAVMGGNPSYFQGDELPVGQVSWDDVREFIRRLNAREPGAGYRLPTEAEWEYACRAGTTADRYGDLDAIAWYDGNSGNAPHPVGRKQPNPWGLYDMLGNFWEWCDDRYEDYPAGPVSDPRGTAVDANPVIRGGSYTNPAREARASCRNGNGQGNRGFGLGFRLARAAR